MDKLQITVQNMSCIFTMMGFYANSSITVLQDNEKSRDILIEQRFHKQLIGQRGESIKEIRDKYNQVQISLPDSGKKSDIVTLRGPKEDVDDCYQHLIKLNKDLVRERCILLIQPLGYWRWDGRPGCSESLRVGRD